MRLFILSLSYHTKEDVNVGRMSVILHISLSYECESVKVVK